MFQVSAQLHVPSQLLVKNSTYPLQQVNCIMLSSNEEIVNVAKVVSKMLGVKL